MISFQLRIAFVILFFTPALSVAQTQDLTFPLGLNVKIYQTIPAVTLPFADSLVAERNRRPENKQTASEVAVNLPVAFTPGNNGSWNDLSPEYKTWFLKIRSPQAHGIALVIRDLRLLEGEKLFVYNMNGITGSFSSHDIPPSGILPLNFLKGDEIVVEYSVPTESADAGSFTIETVSHAFRDIFSDNAENSHESNARNQKSTNDDCYTCLEAPSLDNSRRATVKIVIFSNTGALLCTGTLLNNTARDRRPYILTAQHCISDPEEASRTLFIFDFEDPACGATSFKESFTLRGSTYRASLYEHDFALVELHEKPPAAFKPYYAGWDISDKNLTDVFTIHHPGGGPKKVSVSNEKVTTASFNDGTERASGAYWRVDRWDLGVTEGGSSGAPLFNSDNYLIGTLTGGSSQCGIPLNDYFQRLSSSWEASEINNRQLKHWLDPLQSGATILEGLDPVEGEIMDCEPLSNFQSDEAPWLLSYLPGEGYYSGYNSDGIATYAERFFTEGNAILTTVRFNIADINTASPGGIIVTVYGEENGLPGAALSETFVPYYRLRANGLNTVELSTPVNVSDVFYVGFTMSYSQDDTFAVFQALWRDDGQNSAFVKLNDGWHPITAISPTGTGSALDIQAILCHQPPPFTPDQYNTAIVYPSPCKSVLLAKGPFASNEELRVEISDMQGKTHLTGYHLYGGTLVVTVSGLNPGMYIIRMSSGGKVYQSRFVKE